MKNLILFLVGISLVAVVGCTKKTATSGSASKTLVVWEQEDAQVAPYIDKTIAAFKALPENKDIEIKRVHYGTEDLHQQFQTSSIAGTPPDLIMSPSDTAGVFSISGFIHPLNQMFDFSKYNEAVVQAITQDGKTWGVPVSNGNHLMFLYNKKLVKEVPKSTEEFFKWCSENVAKLKLKYCMATNQGEPFWIVPWLGSFGGWPIDGKIPTLDNPAMLKTVQMELDMKFNKKIVPLECDYNCMDTLFKEGKVAFIINGDWSLSTYQEKFGADFGAARIPMNSETKQWPSPMVSGKYFMISSKVTGEKLELVKRFVSFYTNKENQVEQVKMLKRLPALKEASNVDEINNDPVLKASMDQILVGKPMPMATEMRAIWDAIRPALGRILTQKDKPEDGVKKMQQDATNKIKEMHK